MGGRGTTAGSVILVLLSLATGSAAASGYVAMDLGVLPGGTFSVARAINHAGEIVGSSDDASGAEHACLWRSGTITDLGALPGGVTSVAYGINDVGQVVGASAMADGHWHASLWQNGTVTDLGMLPGTSDSQAADINGSGQIVGHSGLHACLWQDGTPTQLGVLPGGSEAWASAINEAGQIVGWSGVSGGSVHACLWQDGTITDLGALLGDTLSAAYGINDLGQIVGTSGEAYLWENGTATNLGALSAGATSHAWAINNLGQIAGASETMATGSMHACLWQDGTITDLGPAAGDIDCYAYGLNDSGQIVGWSGDVEEGGGRACLWQWAAVAPPQAEFVALVRTGVAPLTVGLQDMSSGFPSAWLWDLGDGGTSAEQNVYHTYADPGSYTISLTATNSDGSDTETKPRYILVTFPDVPFEPEEHWALHQILACVEAGIVQGYPSGDYAPDEPVTRDQMAVYIARALVIPSGDAAIPDPESPPTFSDVAADHWAYKWVEYAVSRNVVQGYTDGTYRPDEVVNRGQMAVYIARALVSPTGDAAIPDPGPHATFADVPGEENAWAWCYGHVEYLAGRGVVQGYSDGTYRPEVQVTRDQMAVYVARAFELPL